LVKEPEKRADVLDRIASGGGLRAGVSRGIARETGVPEAEVYGAGSFFHLLAQPEIRIRVCQGLSCAMRGATDLLALARASGLPAEGCSCLGACDRAPAVLRDRRVLPEVSRADVERAAGEWRQLRSAVLEGDGPWRGAIGPQELTGDAAAIHLAGAPDYSGRSLARAAELGADGVIEILEAAGLQGRGGAGFPAATKWRTVREQPERRRYVVLNGDEGEPGTFKDREVLLRRPDRVVEGLVIAARTVGADDVFCYLRGEFELPRQALEDALARFASAGVVDGIAFHLHSGHGAYICGEETALLEALEGRRGMPRLRPPFPAERGLWGKPTLIHNVETIACVPAVIERGAAWFRSLGRTAPGTKLYSISGDVARPGVYELPLGVTLDELAATAGGYLGALRAFCPGGASAGVLPAAERSRPLDFESLAAVGSMLGTGGVVVLNDSVDLVWAVRQQLRFFEEESCGQCAPCRIGTRFQRECVDRFRAERHAGRAGGAGLANVAEVAWEMNEGSICGLGQAAALPLMTALRHFPEEFSHD
jgi:NADH:ubiquinone oxidoreductase subunit F (NADH-binding)